MFMFPYMLCSMLVRDTHQHTASQLFTYRGHINSVPQDESDGLLSVTVYQGPLQRFLCAIQCVRTSGCYKFYFTKYTNQSSECITAKPANSWTDTFRINGDTMLYTQACSTTYSGQPKPRDCKAYRDAGTDCDGKYLIYPDGVSSKQVHCDMYTFGGGWTIFQKRSSDKTDFSTTWENYKNGFGDEENFWLGNKHISDLTALGQTEMYIIMTDWSGAESTVRYSHFFLSDESDKYRLVISGFSGTVGDSLGLTNGSRFSTKDSDNDIFGGNCVTAFHSGGWWFNACGYSNLNGVYFNGPTISDTSVHWVAFRSRQSLKSTIMMLRRL